MASNSQYFLRSDVKKWPWITMFIRREGNRRCCQAIVYICRECNKRADVRYVSWCDVHRVTNGNCGKHHTKYFRERVAGEMCYGCLIISRKFLKHPPKFRKKHRKQRKQKKSRALAPFDRDKKKRRKYKGPKEMGEKRKKSSVNWPVLFQALISCILR
ncbi:uncharacterized protein EAE98_008916 [Botrytis deweyae]|uniref:Uncharacterized protein n=1 Tax=Botrytis deweyae TaxID=2478750 RepID=A0ABQ7IDH7_9HELO|nr:uncharacterized protein EAE98_008916 [Botrytis deweyae]KAF7920887.1 hypothetical protein EAE98_008916 [Botrytis deweyae]